MEFMATLIGQIATDRNGGLIQHRNASGDVSEVHFLAPLGYLRHQPARIPLLVGHDEGWEVGEVGHLERSKAEGLLAVAHVRDDAAELLSDGEWFLSAGVTTRSLTPRRWERGLLSEISLGRDPAACSIRPVCWSPHTGAPSSDSMPLGWYRAWHEGVDRIARAKYRSAEGLEINDVDHLDLIDEGITDPAAAEQRLEELKRSAPPRPQRTTAVRADRALQFAEGGKVYRHATGGFLVASD
jgi:hypothetical protein